MPTDNEQQVQQRTKKYAAEVEKELKEMKSEEGPKTWRQAELISEVVDKSLWQILGYDSRKAFWEQLFIARSTWYSRLKAWGWAKVALEREAIARARLNRMPIQNVKQLLRLDERRRFDQRWIEKALAMKESDFEAAVDGVLENDDDDAVDQPESRSLLKINCSISQKEFILESLAEFAKRQNPPLDLDDEARILELAMADMRAGADAAMNADLRAWVEAGRPSNKAPRTKAAQASAAVQ